MSLNPFSWFRKKDKGINAPPPSVPPSGPPSDGGGEDFGTPSVASEEAQTLSDIIRGIAHAASAADEIQDQQFVEHLKHYFHRLEDGTLVPRVVRTKIDENTFVEAPLISLIDPATIGLEKMTVRMGVRLSQSKVKKCVQDAKRNTSSRASFGVSLTSCKPGERQDIIDVTMEFKRAEAPEGVSQVIEMMNGTIQPKKFEDNDDPTAETNIFTNSQEKKIVDDDGDGIDDGFTPHDQAPNGHDPLEDKDDNDTDLP